MRRRNIKPRLWEEYSSGWTFWTISGKQYNRFMTRDSFYRAVDAVLALVKDNNLKVRRNKKKT